MKTTARVLALSATSVCALAFLLAKSRMDRVEERDRYHELLVQLQKVDAAVNEEILEARHGHLLNYDPLVKNLHDLEAGAARLDGLPALGGGARERARLREQVDEVRRLAREKAAVVERFKSENATLRNSLAFFPVAAAELADALDAREHALAVEVQALLRDVLVYNLQSTEASLPRIEARLASLAVRGRARPDAAWKADLRRVLEHGSAILERKTRLDAFTRDALGVPVRAALLRLQTSHAEQSRRRVSATNDYRLALYLFATALLAIIAYSYLRLRNISVALDRANATLEQRVRDRTEELERATRELADREAQLALAQEVSHTGSWVLDEGGGLSCSAELCRILGVAARSAPSREALLARVHPDDRPRVAGALDRALASRSAFEAEHRVVRADGEARVVHTRARVLAGAAGARVVGTVQDVTERKEMQTKLMHAERMASLGTLAGGIAHEINNPLAYVTSNLRFVAEELADIEAVAPPRWMAETREALRECTDGAERLRRIVQDLQAFTRPTTSVGPVDVHEVLDLAASIAASHVRYRAALVKDYGEVPRVRGDASRLGQVALNLIVNAAQAIPEGRPAEHEVRVATRMEGRDRVVIEVSDTGCGIPDDVRAHLFEPFLTTKPVGEGTGLGLSICHGIVTSLGGGIAVESAVGKGSTFRVTIPVAAEGGEEPASAVGGGEAATAVGQRARGRYAARA